MEGLKSILVFALLYVKLVQGQNVDGSWVLVVGGDYTNLVELISLDPINDPVPQELRYPRPFPHLVNMAAGASLTQDNVPVVCGGYYGDEEYYSNQCFAYNGAFDYWYESGRTAHERFHSGFSTLHPDLGLVLTGGFSPTHGFTETTLDGVVFREVSVPSLPNDTYRHCQVTVGADKILVLGGRGDCGNFCDQTLMYTLGSSTWEEIPRMPTARMEFSCGVVGDRYVIAAGGDNTTHVLDSVDVLDTETMEWSAGPSLPWPISFAASVQYDETFALIGGYSDAFNGGSLDDVLLFNTDITSWIFTGETLTRPKAYVTAFPVAKETFSNVGK